MRQVLLPGTDIQVSRLGLGTGSLHHLFWNKNRIELLRRALDVGITHFDTSPYYGFGLSEIELGKAVRGRRDRITISTKVGLYPPGRGNAGAIEVWSRKIAGKAYSQLSSPRPDWNIAVAEQSLSASLRRLRTDYVDFLFLHEPDHNRISTAEWVAWLEKCAAAGRIRTWGLAGEPHRLKPWISTNDRLAATVQTRDSILRREADVLCQYGRPMQFTYGYLSTADARTDARSVISAALTRNSLGAVIFSSRRPERIAEFAELTG